MNKRHKATWKSAIEGIGRAILVGIMWLLLYSTMFSHFTDAPLVIAANVFRKVEIRMPAGSSNY